MASKKPRPEDAAIDAALKLAETRPWREIRLADIASEAKLSLAQLATVAVDKTDLLRLFARRTDRKLLQSLEADPVEGEPLDRLFDILMRRFELMAPHRKAIARLIDAPPGAPADWLKLVASTLETQGWVLTAAGIEDHGAWRALKRNGLAFVYARALRVWANEEDSGMSRTMSTLDRSLRDGATWLRRAETPIALMVALSGLARGLVRGSRTRASGAADAPPAA